VHRRDSLPKPQRNETLLHELEIASGRINFGFLTAKPASNDRFIAVIQKEEAKDRFLKVKLCLSHCDHSRISTLESLLPAYRTEVDDAHERHYAIKDKVDMDPDSTLLHKRLKYASDYLYQERNM